MAAAILVLLSMALAISARQQPYYYPQYQPGPPPAPRGDYGRAIGQTQQPPYPYYGQQGPYAPLTVGQQRPDQIQAVPAPGYGQGQGPPPYGWSNALLLPENIFRQQGIPEQQRYLTPPSLKFKIGLISDHHKVSNRDEDSGLFKAYLREGHLYIQHSKENPETPNITLEFSEEKPHELESGINFRGRGFEFSTLNVFNGKLYACDDETGVVYELKKLDEGDDEVNKQGGGERDVDRAPNQGASEEEKEKKYRYVAEPWRILSNEGQNRGFKCEWGVVKDNRLWLGSTGALTPKESKDPDNTELSKERQFVKVVDANGEITTLDWTKNYEKISEVYDVNLRQGHIVHEAAAWSDTLNKWVFVPRRVTKEKQNEETWDKISTNEGVITDDSFNNIQPRKFGNLTENYGVLGLRFIPGTQDQFLLTLKAGEDDEGHHFSTLSVLDIQGNEVLPETRVGDDLFYAAVEFL